jgi:hypothetical protein
MSLGFQTHRSSEGTTMMKTLDLTVGLRTDPSVESDGDPSRVARLTLAVAEAETGSPDQLRTARRLFADHLAEHFPGQVIEYHRGVCHWVDTSGSLHSFTAL